MSYNTNNASCNVTAGIATGNTKYKLTCRCHKPLHLTKAQAAETYGEVCIFQLQDIDQFLDETSIEDRVQVFLSRVGVNYNATTFFHRRQKTTLSKHLRFNVHFLAELNQSLSVFSNVFFCFLQYCMLRSDYRKNTSP